MDKKTQTVESYNHNAQSLAKKFDDFGARTNDIVETFALVKIANTRTLEIGCGNGRDAAEILKYTDDYLGVDISEKLIALARQKVLKGNFVVADIESYIFPAALDVIFAFASLIHVPKESLRQILASAWLALNENGVMRLSMKHGKIYSETTKVDEFGVRTYYLYTKKDLASLANGFMVLKNEVNNLRGQNWIEIILQKKTPLS